MDLPSGDHAIAFAVPCRSLIFFIPLTAMVQTKMFSCLDVCQSPSLPEHPDRKASCLPSGDQMGWEAVQTPGLLLVTSPIVSGEMTRSQAPSWADPAGAMPVRCSSEPCVPRTVQATLLPSGEMATETGVRT